MELYGTEEKKYHALDAQDHLIDAFVYIMKLTTTKIQLVLWFQDKRLHFTMGSRHTDALMACVRAVLTEWLVLLAVFGIPSALEKVGPVSIHMLLMVLRKQH